jgi:L-lactate utilization protein LutB
MGVVVKCENCCTCVELCPYELPIPEILKKNYDLFGQQRRVLVMPEAEGCGKWYNDINGEEIII